MSELDRARWAGMVGVLLGVLVPIAGLVVAVLGHTDLLTDTPLQYVPYWLFVGYALWVLSRLAGARRILWFYAAWVAASLTPFVSLQALVAMFNSGVLTPDSLDLIFESLLAGASLASGVFLYLSLMTVSRKMGYALFMWAGAIFLVRGLGSSLGYVTGLSGTDWQGLSLSFALASITLTLGYAGLILEAFAFSSLGRGLRAAPRAVL